MYPTAYVTIRPPTPVMTRHMNTDRRSTRRFAGRLNAPLLIQVQYVKSCAALFWSESANRISVATKPSQTTPGPISRTAVRGMASAVSARTNAPAAGSRSRARATACSIRSALELAQLVDVVDVANAEDVDEDGQTDHRLRRRHGHRHQREQLALEVVQLRGERDQRQVRGVEHQLDADQDHDRVAPDQHADRAQQEQDEGDAQDEPGIQGPGADRDLTVVRQRCPPLVPVLPVFGSGRPSARRGSGRWRPRPPPGGGWTS